MTEAIRCSFCLDEEAENLIMAHGAYICDSCVRNCVRVLREKKKKLIMDRGVDFALEQGDHQEA